MKKLTNTAYHATSGISASQVKLLLDNPYRFLHNESKAQTQDMLLGSVIHKLILEPEHFDDEYAVSPKFDARTKKGKEDKQNFALIHAGKQVITSDMFNTAVSCADSVMASKAKALLKEGIAEYSFFGELVF